MQVYLGCPVCGKSIVVTVDSEYIAADRQIGVHGGNDIYGIAHNHTCVDYEDSDGNALTVTDDELTIAVQEVIDQPLERW